MNITRLWETLVGKPHLHANADMVSVAAKRLNNRAEELARIIKPYRESEDPLVMLLTDAIIQRGFKGRQDGKT